MPTRSSLEDRGILYPEDLSFFVARVFERRRRRLKREKIDEIKENLGVVLNGVRDGIHEKALSFLRENPPYDASAAEWEVEFDKTAYRVVAEFFLERPYASFSLLLDTLGYELSNGKVRKISNSKNKKLSKTYTYAGVANMVRKIRDHLLSNASAVWADEDEFIRYVKACDYIWRMSRRYLREKKLSSKLRNLLRGEEVPDVMVRWAEEEILPSIVRAFYLMNVGEEVKIKGGYMIRISEKNGRRVSLSIYSYAPSTKRKGK